MGFVLIFCGIMMGFICDISVRDVSLCNVLSYRSSVHRSMMLIELHDCGIPREIEDLRIGDDVLEYQCGGIGMD